MFQHRAYEVPVKIERKVYFVEEFVASMKYNCRM
jgi:hypothetical protein